MKKITETSIKKYLNDDSFSFEVFDTIDSTNSYARRILSDGCDKRVIIADMQTEGRGRQGRDFYSPKNNGIYMSVILKIDKFVEELELFTVAIASITCNAIEKVTGLDCKIKWVNDIFIGRKKICGILCENILSEDFSKVEYVIVGIGINVASVKFFPEELSQIAGAIEMDIDRNFLISEILKEIYGFSTSYKFDKYLTEYRDKSLVVGKKISFIINGTKYFGNVVSINDKGNLIVDTGVETIILKSGEIRLLIENVEE